MIKDLYQKQEVLIIDYNKLPENVKKCFRSNENFHNNCYLNFHSEMEPFNYGDRKEDWSDTCTMERIENYWRDQYKNNSEWCKSETLDQFIEEYGLQKEVWLIKESGIDLKGVEKILIEICW